MGLFKSAELIQSKRDMSKQKILDALAVIIIAAFLIAIYLIPSLKEALLQILCNPGIAKFATQALCLNGPFILYFMPFISSCWLILRLFVKITKFASIVDLDSSLCKGIGMLYRKIKALDG